MLFLNFSEAIYIYIYTYSTPEKECIDVLIYNKTKR